MKLSPVFGLCCITLLAFSSFSTFATGKTDYEFEPLALPGYYPSSETDEGGLWMVSDKIEDITRDSPFLIKDEELNIYVRNIVCSMAGEHCRDIRVYILRNPQFNASMYPNGMMHIWSGLLLRVKNEAQLATVIGHEVAHYMRKHSLENWRAARKKSASAMALAVFTGGYGSLFSLAILADMMAYSRANEREADAYGLHLLSNAGYQSHEAANVWKYIVEEEKSARYKNKGNIFNMSHPSPKGRVKELLEQADALQQTEENAQRVGELEYRAKIAKFMPEFLDAEINQKLPGRTETLLTALEQSNIKEINLDYFWGLFYRNRNEEGDSAMALARYNKAIESENAPPAAYRDMGYLMFKSDQRQEASDYFRRYLELEPTASDREMIQYYLAMDEQ